MRAALIIFSFIYSSQVFAQAGPYDDISSIWISANYKISIDSKLESLVVSNSSDSIIYAGTIDINSYKNNSIKVCTDTNCISIKYKFSNLKRAATFYQRRDAKSIRFKMKKKTIGIGFKEVFTRG